MTTSKKGIFIYWPGFLGAIGHSVMKNAEAKKMTKNLGAKNISKNAKRILREAV